MRARPLALFCVGLLCSCASSVRGRLRGTEQVIGRARAQGAYRCAPRELARAEAHAEFARIELDAGSYFAARREAALADENATLARLYSPQERCAPSGLPAPAPHPSTPPPVVESRPLDTDGDGIPDRDDKCPNEPEDRDDFEDDDGCPDADNDHDGILDRDDKCPNEPEDRDGFEDEDGCPDPDNDHDGLADADDRCPNEAGPKEGGGCPDHDRDGDQVVDRLDKCPDVPGAVDNDGCPKQKYIVVKKDRIELKQKVHFATNLSRIMPDSFAMLDEIADVLRGRPEVRVRIEGHTDARGSLKHNMKLSQARADSVRSYLVRAGIDGDRMEARGFGPSQPIGENRTAVGREQNRRVEFIITSQ